MNMGYKILNTLIDKLDVIERYAISVFVVCCFVLFVPESMLNSIGFNKSKIPIEWICLLFIFTGVLIIFKFVKWIRRFLPNYEQINWPYIDTGDVELVSEFNLDGITWALIGSRNHPIMASYARCNKCNITADCYEDHSRLKVKIRCPNCGFKKHYRGNMNSLLENITNKYNVKQ